MKHVQGFVDNATRDKPVLGLKTRNAAGNKTEDYIDDIAQDGATSKWIRGDETGELRRSVKVKRTLVD